MNVCAFTDSNPEFWGGELLGVKIISPGEINKTPYDKIHIGSFLGVSEIYENLITKYGIAADRIEKNYAEYPTKSRETFLRTFAKLVYDKNLRGDCAECGVFRGEFAKCVNGAFPDRKLYLFDTFEGFAERDLVSAEESAVTGKGYLNYTDIDFVKSVLPNPARAVFRAGYFPETAAGIDGEFVFVNLDFDLYMPTLKGLEFFFPKVVKGGVVLIHDYFNERFGGVKKAVDEFCGKENINGMPTGDTLSIALLKQS